MGFGADRIVALEVSRDQVVRVNQFPHSDGLSCEADNLVELTDGLSRSDGADRQLVTGGDVGARSEDAGH